MQSPNDTLIGPGPSITDAAGNVWTITAGGQVAVNGMVDLSTANVTHLGYANGLVWQENTQDLWWSKASPAAPWSPPYGTTTVPFPITTADRNDTVIGAPVAGSPSPRITDASGNIWSIKNGQVTVNGVVDPTTANVKELAYVNGKIWQENSQNRWWSKSAPADGWQPPNGTAANPVTGSFYINNIPGNAAIINVAELTASPEGGSGTAPQSISEIVTPGVSAAGTAITVSTETATLVVNGNSSLTAGATLNLIGAYRTPTEISGPLQNNGVMALNNAKIKVGALSGLGSIHASNQSTLDIQSSLGGNVIQLQSSHLLIGGQNNVPGGMSFAAPITMDAASTVMLANTQATSELLRHAGGSVSEVLLYNGTGEVADLKIKGVANIYATESGTGAGSTVALSAVHTAQSLPIVSHIP